MDKSNPHTASEQSAGAPNPLSSELHNDRTHDSTVDTDGKNHEAARIAGHAPIGPDEITTSNATHDNAVPEDADGLAGFDSRIGGNSLRVAVQPGYTVIDKGMVEPPPRVYEGAGPVPERRERGRLHFAINHVRPARVIEFKHDK